MTITPQQWAKVERGFYSRYYVLGGVTPVRVLFAKRFDGEYYDKAGAIAPDPDTGKLAWRHELLSRLEQSHEVEEIDRSTYDRLCHDFRRRKG